MRTLTERDPVVMNDGSLKQLNEVGGGGESYTLPAATAENLGGVKIGDGVTVAEDGTISVSGGGGGGTAHLYLVGLKYNYAWLTLYLWSDETTIDGDTVYTALRAFIDASAVWFYYPANGYYTNDTKSLAIVGVQAGSNSFIVWAPGIGQYSMPKGSTTVIYKQIY